METISKGKCRFPTHSPQEVAPGGHVASKGSEQLPRPLARGVCSSGLPGRDFETVTQWGGTSMTRRSKTLSTIPFDGSTILRCAQGHGSPQALLIGRLSDAGNPDGSGLHSPFFISLFRRGSARGQVGAPEVQTNDEKWGCEEDRSFCRSAREERGYASYTS